jgi:hypothetical protein
MKKEKTKIKREERELAKTLFCWYNVTIRKALLMDQIQKVRAEHPYYGSKTVEYLMMDQIGYEPKPNYFQKKQLKKERAFQKIIGEINKAAEKFPEEVTVLKIKRNEQFLSAANRIKKKVGQGEMYAVIILTNLPKELVQ